MPRVDVCDARCATLVRHDLGFPRGIHEVFEMKEQVGKGGFGVVKRVVKRVNQQELACKVLGKVLAAPEVSQVQQARHLDSIRKEVAVLKSLRGTLNVVHLDSVYEDDDNVYIVMEYCRGGEIWHQIGLRPYSEETAARIMRACLRTLSQCHAKRILHRDVKPGNFMFLNTDEKSPIKAVDFGMAVFFDPKALPRRDLGFDGTPWFMAPEVLSSEVVPASDVWSAGVMAHQLLTGHLPFDDRKNRKSPALSLVWRSILTDDVNFRKPYWMGISDDAKDFVASLLNKDPKKRPSAKEALRHPWVRKGGKNSSTHQLSTTIVQRIQRYGQSNIFKRTVLDLIANELVQAEKEQMSSDGGMVSSLPISSSPDMPSKTWHGGRCGFVGSSSPSYPGLFSQSPDSLKTPSAFASSSRRRHIRYHSHHELPILSNLEDWEEHQKAVRVALDTSVHGAGEYPKFLASELKSGAGVVEQDLPSPNPVGDEMALESTVSGEISLNEAMAIADSTAAAERYMESGKRGQGLFKQYMDRQVKIPGKNGTGCNKPVPVTSHHVAELTPHDAQKHEASHGGKQSPLTQGRTACLLRMLSGGGDCEDAKSILEMMNLSTNDKSSAKELRAGLKRLGMNVEEGEVRALLENMGPSNEGQIQLSQFVASQLDWRHLQQNHSDQWLNCVQQAFQQMDRDGDGRISSQDLIQAVGDKFPVSYVDLSIEQAKLEACAEENGMDFEHFLQMCRVDSHESLASLDQYDSRSGLSVHPSVLDTVSEI